LAEERTDHNVKAKRALKFVKDHGGDTERFDYLGSLLDNTYDDGYDLGYVDGGNTVRATTIEYLNQIKKEIKKT
jgi:hypothetical protein